MVFLALHTYIELTLRVLYKRSLKKKLSDLSDLKKVRLYSVRILRLTGLMRSMNLDILRQIISSSMYYCHGHLPSYEH